MTKTHARPIAISQDAVEALRLLYRSCKEGRNSKDWPVFVGPRKGKRLRGDTVYHAWQRLLAAHGLERMRVHDLRHGVGTLMAADGVHMRLIQEQLGHTDIRMTQRYVHAAQESQRGAIGVLDRLRGKR